MRLKKVKEEYGDRLDVQYRVFMLRAEPDPTAVFNDYRRNGWQRAGAQSESGQFHLWKSDEEFPNCSMPSAEAGLAARAQGPEPWDRFHVNLFTAFFTENRNITDAGVISEVAQKSGLDIPLFLDALRSGMYRQHAIEENREAVMMGITGVPSVVVNESSLLVGAVPTDHYRRVIQNILETGNLSGRAQGELPMA